MEKLTPDHVLGLIDSEYYVVEEQYVQCILMVGEAPVIGTSYRFSKATHNPEMAKKSARENAIRELYTLEAYHQKRLRKYECDSPAGDTPSIDGEKTTQPEEYKVMAERDVTLMYGGVNCQEMFKDHYRGSTPPTNKEEATPPGNGDASLEFAILNHNCPHD